MSWREGPRPDGRGVHEQEEGECRLGQDPDGLGVGRDRDGAEHVVGEEEADGQERERRSDRQAVEPRRDERVAGDQHREDGELDLHARRSTPRRLARVLESAVSPAPMSSRRSVGTATATAPTTPSVTNPPATTDGTVPNRLAAIPLSNAPSSFEAPMNTQLTDATRPRIRSGERTRRIVLRMTMLRPSVTPLKNSATHDTMNVVDRPNTIIETPNPATEMSSVRPAWRLGRPARRDEHDPERAQRRRRAKDPEPGRPDVQDVGREDRQQRDRATEEDGEQVERHRPDQRRSPGDVADPAGQALDDRLARHDLRHRLARDDRRGRRSRSRAGRR